MDQIVNILILVVALVFSIILHELAHGAVALLNGDDTAKKMGRLTFNPVAHFDLIGFLMLLVLRFGYAKPVPVNPYNFKNKNVGMITVSLAGVVTNLLLAFVFYPILIVAYAVPYLYLFATYMVIINLNLAIFNLLPLYPLDGYRLLNCFVPSDNKVMTFLRANSRYILLLLLGLGIICDMLNLPIYFDPLSWLLQTVAGFIMKAYKAFWVLFIR